MNRVLRTTVFVVLTLLMLTAVDAFATQIPLNGQVLSEDFENGSAFSEIKIITEQNGNNAMYICNEFTDSLYALPQNIEIEGAFKVLSTQENAIFEISTQSSTENEAYFGGMHHNLFSVDLNRGYS